MTRRGYISFRKISFFLALVFCCYLFLGTLDVSAAMDDEQRRALQSGARYFNVDPDQLCAAGSFSGGTGEGAFASGEMMAFASLPITSTWNISDSTAEQWFLQQAGARATITKFGLNAGNIGNITAAIKTAGVSPVFFYAYTVNEGGGAGGFINHYRGDATGGGVGNAQRDAEYLATQANIMNSQPAWIDAGNPVDFVPQDVKNSGNANFQSMPAGTIGRAYIPATAATTWEVYYPNGLKREFNQVQNYGAPLNDTMQNIQRMGGDPTQGGAAIQIGGTSSGCPGGASVTQGSLPSGTAQELAKQILASGKVDGDSRYMAQIRGIADGTGTCHVNPTILAMILSLSEQFELNISSLNRRCTGVLTASGTGSFHYKEQGGHAVDFNFVNGVHSTGGTEHDLALIRAAAAVIPKGSGFGQVNCRENIDLSGMRQFNDTCNHVHIEVPVQ